MNLHIKNEEFLIINIMPEWVGRVMFASQDAKAPWKVIERL